MATTITGKLNATAREFQAGSSTGFGIRLGVQYYDRQTKAKEWTNYEFAVFSSTEGQTNFLRSALVAGSVVEVSALSEKIKSFDGDKGQILSIELIDAKLGYILTPGDSAHQAKPTAPAESSQVVDDGFDEDIPF